MANINITIVLIAGFKLKDRFLLFLITISAKPVLWCGRFCKWLMGVHQNTIGNLYELVVFKILVQFLKFNNSLFERVFFFRQTLVLNLYGDKISIEASNSIGEVVNIFSDVGRDFIDVWRVLNGPMKGQEPS